MYTTLQGGWCGNHRTNLMTGPCVLSIIIYSATAILKFPSLCPCIFASCSNQSDSCILPDPSSDTPSTHPRREPILFKIHVTLLFVHVSEASCAINCPEGRMDRKNSSVLSGGWQGFSLTVLTSMCRVNICGCLVPDETVHFQQNLQN